MNSRLYFALHCFLALLAAVLFCLPAAHSAFDPVNDDTDIFLANPNIPAERPNVLIILDNTANWNNAFTNEKSALVSVVNGLSDQFNVGLMMMAETGGGNDSVDGTYVRYHVRQMTAANKTSLSSLVNNLDITGDKSNNNTVGLGLYEAYLYFAGLASNASHGKVKTDHAGTADPLLAPLTGPHALPANPNATSLYNSPITDLCQKNFIIYISNGPANENASARAFVQGKLALLTGQNPPATISIKGANGQQGNWGDEMAKFMADADVNANLDGKQTVVTYTVEVDPSATGQGPDMTALLQSVAVNGKGTYFPVSSSASGTAIVDALTKIFNEVQAVNSVFAASSLPVSVSVRGAFLNQLYVGVFRPDATKNPRWFGNLKLYAFQQDSATKDVFLVDANGVPAVNPATGFITPNAKSFWTAGSNYWGFRPADQNGTGGNSDSPDGEIVEKGGVAQQIRTAYAAAEAATATRNLFTCTTGGSKPDCLPNVPNGSSLSATPFDTSNTAIDNASLGLASRNVSPLSAFQTKPVTAIIDRKPASLTNATSAISVSSLSNGATSVPITSLRTSTPKTVSLLSGLVATPQSVTVSSITKSSGNFVVTAAATFPSNFVNGATVTISGTSNGAYHGSWTISSLNAAAKTFNINASGNPGNATGGTASVTAPADSTTARATVTSHGYASGDSITVAGATPAQFNGTFGITVVDANTFTYTMPSAGGDAVGAITASGNTNTATAITASNHGLAVGNPVSVSGATPSGYNGTFTVASVPNATTFTYTVSTKLGSNSTTPVYMTRGGSTTVTATTTAAHGYSTGNTVNIANSDIAGYNGAFVVTVTGTNTFTFTTSSVLPANSSPTITASTSFASEVTATVVNHGFAAGDTVIIEGGSQPLHNGTFTVLASPAPTPNTFAYSNPQSVAPAGSYTARPPTLNTKATATVTAHGYSNGDQIVISGATPAAYNGTFTITVVDANTFTYPLTSAPGPNSGTSVAARKASTSAVATSVAHGFANGDSVTISGATPAAFNGTYTIALIDANTFSYTLGSPQGDAAGTIVASGAVSAARNDLIRWVRGEDNFADENANGSNTDIRASVHGDTLHSSPVVVNYGRYLDAVTGLTSNNDVYVFYGANDGVFRAVKGGYATDPAAAVQIPPGYEAWGFIPTEFFGSLNRLRTNSPRISSAFKKPYFADGPISLYTNDANDNGKLGDNGDTVNIYVAMRRGGRFIYALNVNNPHDPKFLWKIDSTQAGFAELGQTWSQARVIDGSATAPGLAGLPFPVLVFGAGYDPAVEDIDPAAITSSNAMSVITASGTVNRAMGRGIYVVNALTGALLWRALGTADPSCPVCSTTVAPGMDFAIPSDVALIRNQSGGPLNRGYVGDTGGNLWRLDFVKDASNNLSATVTKIAAIGAHTATDRRKFQFPPSVTSIKGVDTVLIGSGDREHPFDTTVTNRFYAFRDLGSDAGPLTGTNVTNPTIVESALFDATSNCIQESAACGAGGQSAAVTALAAANGWFITLRTGEKVIGNPVTAAGTVFFATNQPSAAAGGGSCGPNLGIARLYEISASDATAVKDLNSSGGLTVADRSEEPPGGGLPPRPDFRPIDLTKGPPGAKPCVGPNCEKIVQCVIAGFRCTTPGGSPLNARLRKYWYKEID